MNNTTNIRTAINSPVQQSGPQSTQKQVITYGRQERSDISRLITEISSHVHELKLSAAAQQKANAQLSTIRVQLNDEPNPIIVQEAGRTLRNVTEGAIAGVAETMKRLFS